MYGHIFRTIPFLLLGFVPDFTIGADFIVTKVGFSDTHANFVLTSSVPKGDSAVVTITEADADKRGEIRTSLRTSPSAPTKIEEDTATGTLKVTVTPATASDVTLQFKRPKLEGEATVRHRIDVSGETLSSEIALDEKSETEANWVNAEVELVLKTGKVSASKVNLKSKAVGVSPTNEFDRYKISAVEPYPKYYRTGSADAGTDLDKVYAVYTLDNSMAKSVASIPAGDVYVFHGAAYLYSRKLQGLQSGKSIDLYGAEADKLSATSPTDATAHIEADSLKLGVLVVREWDVSTTTVTNKTDDDVSVRLGAKSEFDLTVKPAPATPATGYIGKARKSGTTPISLIEIDASNLATRIANVETVSTSRNNRVDLQKLKKVLKIYINIADARKHVTAHETGLASLNAVLNALNADPTASQASKDAVKDAIASTEEKLKTAKENEPREFEKLITELFPTGSKSPGGTTSPGAAE